MFGHKDDDLGNSEDQNDNGGFVSAAHPDPTGAPEPPALDAPDAPADAAPTEPISVAPATDDSTPQFGQPFTPGSVLPAAEESSEPTTTEPSSTEEPAAADTSTDDAATPDATPVADDELIDIKKEALQQLAPLVSHLDQTPEEKFKTTMMMIQAADDQSLVQKAYEAAQQISDDTVKAQALLDIVNEINYFTQHDK